MTLRLNVDTISWKRHFREVANGFGDLIPVVKGNGYGFGRTTLIQHAATLSKEIAVGTVFEAHDVPKNCVAIVLTPAGRELPESLPQTAVLTVGSLHHIENLKNNSWRGSVVVKLRSSMNRYGANNDELTNVLAALKNAGLTQVGWSIHPPLDGNQSDYLTEIKNWMLQVSSDLPWFVSHIDASGIRQLRQEFVQNKIRARSGTALWLGDKSMTHLIADVLDIRSIGNGETAGYRNVKIKQDGAIAMIGVGTSHGVHLVGAELSPFHFNQQRLELVEPSHMHTSMVFIPKGEKLPQVGDYVDVQQPLTRVYPDFISWI
ncbi:MAG: alanine racemase [Actinobacteria bacterium]|nr:alanine racemase [Actinomycetota bacterium]